MPKDVWIVGNGIAGIATAIAFRRKQYRVRLVEGRNILEVGAAVQVTPNGLRAIRMIGGNALLQRVLENSSSIEENKMILPCREIPYDTLQDLPPSPPSDLPTVMIRWSVLRQLLAQELPADCLVKGQLVDVMVKEGVTTFVLQDGSRVECPPDALVVAADGQDSFFRDSPPVPTSRINFKAVVHQDKPEKQSLPTEKTTYALFANGLAVFSGPAGPGWTYWAVSIPSPADHLPNLKNFLLETLHKVSQAQAFTNLILATDESAIWAQKSVEAPLCFHKRDKSVFFVGDAAHPMAGSYGQATSFALEDAATLAHCATMGTSTNPDSVLAKTYSCWRLERCQEMQRKSQERAVRAMRGEATDDIARWIHEWDLKDEPEQDSPMEVVG